MTEKKHLPIELDELLAAEFSYIAQTATQAFEDRARVSSFYLIAVGSLIAALFGTQFFESSQSSKESQLIFGGIFLLLTFLGLSTVMQLAQLRSAWYESMMAMNQLKDFAMKQNPELVNAFRWKTDTLPAKYKRGSVSYYQALEVSLIGGLMFGASTFFFQQALLPAGFLTWIISILLGLLAVFGQMTLHKSLLK